MAIQTNFEYVVNLSGWQSVKLGKKKKKEKTAEPSDWTPRKSNVGLALMPK